MHALCITALRFKPLYIWHRENETKKLSDERDIRGGVMSGCVCVCEWNTMSVSEVRCVS